MIDREKWKDICSTGQSPQWAVVPMEEEDDGLLRPKLVANKRIIIKINIQLCQKVYIFSLK